jgi:hypothetical protein
MKKFLLIFLLLTSTLFGYSYNNLLIKAQSSIFPKILLLDKKLNDKLVEGKIVYTIVCEESDYDVAKKLRDMMKKQYQNRLGNYIFEVNIMFFSKVTTDTKVTAIYVLNSDTGVDKISHLVKRLGCMTFSYDISNLQHGVLLSLMVEKSTVIYLNKKSLPTHNVDFIESLYQIVKVANI